MSATQPSHPHFCGVTLSLNAAPVPSSNDSSPSDRSAPDRNPSDRIATNRKTLRSLEWLNFFVADVQTGLGPFIAAYLASSGWNAAHVGYALTFGGLVTVAVQTPAGAVVDSSRRKRMLVAASLAVLACGAALLLLRHDAAAVYVAQFLIGATGPFLAPTIAAITLGIVGATLFDRQFGKNQAFNSAGNVFTAILVALVSYKFGYRYIFTVAIVLAVPALLSLLGIDGNQIDYARARGATREKTSRAEAPSGTGTPAYAPSIPDANRSAIADRSDGAMSQSLSQPGANDVRPEGISALAQDRVLLAFLAAAFLFHLSNAAMLPELGEMLAKGDPRMAPPFMSACIIVTQLVIAASAAWIGTRAGRGRKPLLLLGFGV